MDNVSFIIGILFCMVLDILFSIANYFVQKALTLRKQRKVIESINEVKERMKK